MYLLFIKFLKSTAHTYCRFINEIFYYSLKEISQVCPNSMVETRKTVPAIPKIRKGEEMSVNNNWSFD